MAAADQDFRRSRAAVVLFALAGAASLFALAGWSIGSPILSSFGVENYPAWPLTALADLSLACALLLTGRGLALLRHVLIAIPVAIGAIALAEYVVDLPPGFDRLLFAQTLGDGSLTPGRPTPLACGLILVTALAAILVDRQKRHQWLIFLLACVMIGLGAMSLALLALQDELLAQAGRLTTPLPIVFATLGNGGGLLASVRLWDARLLWRRAPLSIALALVTLLILPAVQLPIQMRVEQLGVMTPLAAQTFATVFHLLVVIGLIGLAMSQLSRDSEAISGMTMALRESEERLRFAIEAHELGVFEWDVLSGRLSWSMGAEKRLGMEPGTVTQVETWRRFIPRGELRTLRATISDAANRKAERFSFQYHLHLPTGTRAIEGSARCFYDRAGLLIRVVGVDLDVTDREAREAALKAGQTQLQSILETVPDAMVVVDDRGRITKFSAAAERLFGYGMGEAVHCDISMLLPEIEPGRHNAFLARYLGPGARYTVGKSRPLSARRANGSEIPVELSVGESWIGGKHVFTAFIRDISDRLAAEERMEQLNADYAHIARLNGMGEMAAALAHELNQPLAATGNYLGIAEQVLLQAGGDPSAVEALDCANRELLRTGEIIRRLRDFMAKRDVEFHVEDLEEIVRDAIALAFVGQVQVRTICDISPDARMIVVDRIQVQQVLVNILYNAAQAVRNFSPENRIIRIEAETADRALTRVTVKDSGPGFPDDVLANLHAPFVPSRDRGMGIGLSISRRIVESHGGGLAAYNAPEGGAIVTFTLPVYREESESAT